MTERTSRSPHIFDAFGFPLTLLLNDNEEPSDISISTIKREVALHLMQRPDRLFREHVWFLCDYLDCNRNRLCYLLNYMDDFNTQWGTSFREEAHTVFRIKV